MVNLSIKLDTRSLDKALAAIEKDIKPICEDTANRTVYFVARNAVQQTVAASKEQVREDLLKPSAVAPGVPLAAVLVQSGRKTAGKNGKSLKGLAGEKMEAAVEKLIRARQSTVNFLRAGWIPAIKAIEPFVQKKSGAPKYPKVKPKGEPKGGGKAAKANSLWRSVAHIYNSVQGGISAASPQVLAQLIDGLNKAIAEEAKSKMEYYAKKMLKDSTDKFNRTK